MNGLDDEDGKDAVAEPKEPRKGKPRKGDEIAAVKAALANTEANHAQARKDRAEAEKRVRDTGMEISKLKDRLIALMGCLMVAVASLWCSPATADEIHAHVHVYDGTRSPRVTLRDRIRGFINAQPAAATAQTAPAAIPPAAGTVPVNPAMTAGAAAPAAAPVQGSKRTVTIEVK